MIYITKNGDFRVKIYQKYVGKCDLFFLLLGKNYTYRQMSLMVKHN